MSNQSCYTPSNKISVEEKSSCFLLWSGARLSWLTFHMCCFTTTRMCVKCLLLLLLSGLHFFVLPEKSTNTCSTRKTDTVWGTQSHVTLLHPRSYFVSQKGSLDTVNAVRTDIARLQLRWMTGRGFRKRVLKRRDDFSDWVPLKCKRNTLRNSHVWTQMSTCIKSGLGNMTSGPRTLHGHQHKAEKV